MSTYKTHCSKCGAILSNRFCSACGTDSEIPFRKRFLSWFSWMRQYPRFAFWAVLGLFGLAFGIVDEHVDFFEKHAPKLNAAFHSGEITTSGDGEYVMQKWTDDRDKLDADMKDADWQAIRQEMLKRKPYLDDLILENEKFQRRVRVEADSHLDVNDPCESLTIHEAAPLIAQATRVEQEFFVFVERTTTVTPQVAPAMDKILDKQKDISRRMSEFHERWQAKGCK